LSSSFTTVVKLFIKFYYQVLQEHYVYDTIPDGLQFLLCDIQSLLQLNSSAFQSETESTVTSHRMLLCLVNTELLLLLFIIIKCTFT